MSLEEDIKTKQKYELTQNNKTLKTLKQYEIEMVYNTFITILNHESLEDKELHDQFNILDAF